MERERERQAKGLGDEPPPLEGDEPPPLEGDDVTPA